MRIYAKSILTLAMVFASVSPARALTGGAKHLSTKRVRSNISRLIHRTSFSESWSRYPSPDSILNTLRDDFPYASASPYFSSGNACSTLDSSNRVLMGEADPINGLASVDEPTSSFSSWYFECVANTILTEKNEFAYQKRTTAEIQNYYSPEAANVCLQNHVVTSEGTMPVGLYCAWTSLPSSAKHSLVRLLVNRFVGPEEILINQGIAASEIEYENTLIAELDDYAKTPDDRYAMLNLKMKPGEAFRLYIDDATGILSLLIHLQDTLKY